jgi:GNAT superfamily N-acetyltransferase
MLFSFSCQFLYGVRDDDSIGSGNPAAKGGEKLEITLRAVQDTAADQEFLFRVFASTRGHEMAVKGWSDVDVDNFLRMQYRLRDQHYHLSYPFAAFEIVVVDGSPAGRISRSYTATTIHLIELSLLPEFRSRGIGGWILGDLTQEADRLGLLLTLQVDVANPIGTYYQRLGFVEREVRGFYRCMQRLPVLPGMSSSGI